jgi:hypothetical protein
MWLIIKSLHSNVQTDDGRGPGDHPRLSGTLIYRDPSLIVTGL